MLVDNWKECDLIDSFHFLVCRKFSFTCINFMHVPWVLRTAEISKFSEDCCKTHWMTRTLRVWHKALAKVMQRADCQNCCCKSTPKSFFRFAKFLNLHVWWNICASEGAAGGAKSPLTASSCYTLRKRNVKTFLFMWCDIQIYSNVFPLPRIVWIKATRCMCEFQSFHKKTWNVWKFGITDRPSVKSWELWKIWISD